MKPHRNKTWRAHGAALAILDRADACLCPDQRGLQHTHTLPKWYPDRIEMDPTSSPGMHMFCLLSALCRSAFSFLKSDRPRAFAAYWFGARRGSRLYFPPPPLSLSSRDRDIDQSNEYRDWAWGEQSRRCVSRNAESWLHSSPPQLSVPIVCIYSILQLLF